MHASIAVNEMSETLRVLAGDNAANAARHFTQHSYERGDFSSASLWSSIARLVAGPPAPVPARARAEPSPADTFAIPRIDESIAFQGVRYEDVDAETLAREEEPPIAVQPFGDPLSAGPKSFEAAHAGDRAEQVAPAQAPEIELAQAA